MDHTGTRPRLRLLLITAIVVLGLMGACLLTIASLDDEGRAAFLAETGPVEIASAGCYIAMAIMLGLFAALSRADRLFAVARETGVRGGGLTKCLPEAPRPNWNA